MRLPCFPDTPIPIQFVLKEDPLPSKKRTSRIERYLLCRGRHLLSLYEQHHVQLLYLLTKHLFQ